MTVPLLILQSHVFRSTQVVASMSTLTVPTRRRIKKMI